MHAPLCLESIQSLLEGLWFLFLWQILTMEPFVVKGKLFYFFPNQLMSEELLASVQI